MIASFWDKGSSEIWEGLSTKAARQSLPVRLWKNARDLLDQLDAATRLGDMRLPPSNNLHELKGDLSGFWAVKINKQYRIIFRFEEGQAHDVKVTDYH